MSLFHCRTNPMDRRALLRGGSVALGLPLLEAMLPARALAQSVLAPKRLIYLYVPNGVNMEEWFPHRPSEGTTAVANEALSLGSSLLPLFPHRQHISLLSGLTLDKARPNGDGPGDHARASAAFLTCVQPLKAEGAVQLGISADQAAAAHLRGSTPFPSLTVGGEAPRSSGQCDSGYACAYSSHLSWRSATQPAAKETDPVRLFDRLFRGGANLTTITERREHAHRRRSLLDYVREDASKLHGLLGSTDRQTLERYLTAVRDLEIQLAALEKEDLNEVADEMRPNNATNKRFDRLRIFNDLITLALATDRTRVVTFLTANEGSNRAYSELGIHEGHHSLSHHGKDPAKMKSIARIDRANAKVLAHLLESLASHQEAGGSLLDNSAVVYGSGIASGNAHKHHNLPILLCGRMGGALRPGRHIQSSPDTPLANLHLHLLRCLGVNAEQHGDSTGVLDVV
jgi:hypothetical protein